jgi:F0F1-type ATP synthase membrane subunit b/b'
MELKLDLIFAHLIIFMIVLWACKKLYIEPILRLLNKRESLTSGRLDTSQELQLSLQKMKSEYSQSWDKAKEEFEKRRNQQLKEVREHQSKKLSNFQKDLETKMMERQSVLKKELQALESQVPLVASDLAKEIEVSMMSAKVVKP